MAKAFERREIRTGDRFEIWERRAGDEWTRLVDRNEFREQYGPYRQR
jgi:hypothetical protein